MLGHREGDWRVLWSQSHVPDRAGTISVDWASEALFLLNGYDFHSELPINVVKVRRSLSLWDHSEPSLGRVQPSLRIISIECVICHPKAMVSVGSILVLITHGDTPNPW